MKKQTLTFRLFSLLALSVVAVFSADAAIYKGCNSVYNSGASDCQSGGLDLYRYSGSCSTTATIDSAESTCNAQLKYYDPVADSYSTGTSVPVGSLQVATYSWGTCTCNSTCDMTNAATVQADVQATCSGGQIAVFNGGSCQYSCQTVTPTYLTKYVGGTGSAIESSVVFQDDSADFTSGSALGVGTTDPTGALDIRDDADETEDLPILRAIQTGTRITTPFTASTLLQNLLAKFQNAVDSTLAGFGAFLVFNDGTIGIEQDAGGGATTITQIGVNVDGTLNTTIYDVDNTGSVTTVNPTTTIGGGSGKFVDGTPDTAEAVYTTGNVGVGTVDPKEKFQIGDELTFHDGGSKAFSRNFYYDGDDKRLVSGYSQAIYYHGSGDMTLRTADTGVADSSIAWIDGITLKNDGKVGILQASPTEALEVNGNVLADEHLYSSDIRLKENISPIKNALGKVLSLAGVYFDWKKTGKTNVGFIAQQVEQVVPEVVTGEGDAIKSVSYGNITALLVEAIREQQTQIEELKAQVEELSK